MTRLPRPRATLSVKLALILFGVVLGALGIVYLFVVPRLENRLVDAKIGQLERALPALADELRNSSGRGVVGLRETVDFAAANLNARVVVFSRLAGTSLVVMQDSIAVAGGGDVSDDPVVHLADRTRLPASGRVERDGRSFAEAAAPFGPAVVLISAPLDDALADVRLVRRSVVVAGLVALVAAGIAGYLAAWGFTRRLRRLEAAAERIAHGDFGVPIDADGSDEVAELARGLETMRERLARLDRLRGEFIANASHELRTPLFSLGGFLELLADEDLDPETRREFLNETRAQVERLARLATDLLDLSRLDAGQLRVEKVDVDLGAAARTVAEEFRALAESSGHPLSVQGGAVQALADEQRVLQIGRILVENAIRHTPAGTPVEISAVPADGNVALSVRDGGPGIATPDQEHLFERFYRARGGHASGSGLGLAIAWELARRMDGSLGVDSRPGETVFSLLLPPGAPFSRENGRAEAPASAPA